MAQSGVNTFPEFIRKLSGDIGQAFALPDADLQFLTAVQQLVVGIARQPIENMQAAGTTSVQSNPMMAPGAPGGGMGAPQGLPSNIAGTQMRGMAPPRISADELMRAFQ